MQSQEIYGTMEKMREVTRVEIIEKAPAKINLGLDTLFKRPDGYHELAMIMASVDLSDHVTLSTLPENKIIVETNKAFLPNDKKNHAYQVAEAVREKFGITTGIKITIDKKIPIAAGLGGGSTDAAATVRGLNRLFQLDLSLPEMAEIGLVAGSDVPYCVYGKTALVTGFGEIVTPIPDLPPCWVVLVKPPVSVSTPKIFQALQVEKVSHPDIAALEQAIIFGDYPQLIQHLGNSLEEVTCEKYPIVTKVKEKMLRFGADGAMMSGSGPTVFGLCQKYSRAQRVYNALKGFCDEVYLVRTL